jgi:hypothetical protein
MKCNQFLDNELFALQKSPDKINPDYDTVEVQKISLLSP